MESPCCRNAYFIYIRMHWIEDQVRFGRNNHRGYLQQRRRPRLQPAIANVHRRASGWLVAPALRLHAESGNGYRCGNVDFKVNVVKSYNIVGEMNECLHGGQRQGRGEINGSLPWAVPTSAGKPRAFAVKRLPCVPAFDDPKGSPQE